MLSVLVYDERDSSSDILYLLKSLLCVIDIPGVIRSIGEALDT